MEVGRGLDAHGVQLLLQHALVARQSGITSFGLHIQLVAEGVDAILEVVRGAHDVVAAMFLEQTRNPRAAAAAANEADIDFFIGL